MKLYIKQKVFSWRDRFRVFDENENDLYAVQGEVWSLGKKLHIFSASGDEVGFIHQKVWSFKSRFFVAQNGEDIAEVVKEITLFKPVYTVSPQGWNITGNFWAHEYTIESASGVIATISKHWFTWGDTYEIDIADGIDPVLVLSVVLIIDAVMAQQSHAATAGGGSSSH